MSFLLNFWFIAVGLFCLGFSIFIHELGHFLAAKKRGLIADRFSIGFGPRLFGWHKDGTDFRISLLPLGGYVSLPQLADMGRLEGGEKEEDRLPPISYTDKMIVAVMGAVFNLIFAFLLSLIVWGMGRDVVNTTEVAQVAKEIRNSEGKIIPGPAFVAGVKPGDRILKVDGDKVRSWNDYQSFVALSLGRAADDRPQVNLTILRDDAELELEVYPALVTSEKMRYLGLAPPTVEGKSGPVVIALEKDMPAYAAGLKPEDQLIKLDGEDIISSQFLTTYLASHIKGPIEVTIIRDGAEQVIPITPRIKTENGETAPRFGFSFDYPYLTERIHQNPAVQLTKMADTMRRTLIALIHRNSDVKVRNMQAVVGIVDNLSMVARNGFVTLCFMLALINVNLAIFNLLPIPVLDGGHMLFATINKVSGRQLPRVFMEKVQFSFVIILLGLMAYITFFDVSRLGRRLGLIKDPVYQESPAETVEPEQAANAPE